MAATNQEDDSSTSTCTCSDYSYTKQHRGNCHVARQLTDLNTGILDEQVLFLVFRQLNWDPQTLCTIASTNRRLRAVADRVLFFELCLSRAPRFVSSIMAASSSTLQRLTPGSRPRLPGGWHALAKLLLFCCGCKSSRFFSLSDNAPGHFVSVSRFSKTSGQSFILRRFCGDILYVSDPCEHASPTDDCDLGAYRGVFCGFMQSRTRACLVERNIKLETQIRCPYCGARVWSMSGAGLIPKCAARRLGSQVNKMEYFICVFGHLHGSCWLPRLSSSSSSSDDDDDDDESGNDNPEDDEADGANSIT